jgi:hypothetical protein
MKKIEQEARRMCRHTVVYTAKTDIRAASLAMMGRTTKSIARDLDITESQAQYRIKKAQDSLDTRFRANYRNGDGALVFAMQERIMRMAETQVRKFVTPKFVPFARAGVPRTNQ